MALLDVKNLRVEFPTRHGVLVAVDDISLEIAEGEVLGVVGESGAGKSMTGSAIIGLLEPPGRIAGGRIVLDGQIPEEEIARKLAVLLRLGGHQETLMSGPRRQRRCRLS